MMMPLTKMKNIAGAEISKYRYFLPVSQNKDIQKCNFHYKTVRRFFTEIVGGHFLASALKRGIHPRGILNFQYVFRGVTASL
jgi:hypothetical protein